MSPLSSPSELAKRGIYTFEKLEESLGSEVNYVIEGMFTERSVNLLAGDSGIGKTPLLVTIALCIAGGIPFLGNKIPKPRRVLYCDAESSRPAFVKIVETISKHLGFKSVPVNFHVWSPNWDSSQKGIDYAGALWRNVEWNGFKPEVIFVDPLRVFFPEADLKRDVTMKNLAKMRRVNDGGCTWCICHHTRKPSHKDGQGPPSIEDDPHTWFHEVAGQHAIINHVDTRLGVEVKALSEGCEMVMGGFVRMLGPIPPMYLARKYSDGGDPIGYVRASSLDLLKSNHKDAFHKLPGGGTMFRFKDAKAALGKADSSVNNFLKRLESISAIKKVSGGYIKVIQ